MEIYRSTVINRSFRDRLITVERVFSGKTNGRRPGTGVVPPHCRDVGRSPCAGFSACVARMRCQDALSGVLAALADGGHDEFVQILNGVA
jgi:hypothetical protein